MFVSNFKDISAAKSLFLPSQIFSMMFDTLTDMFENLTLQNYKTKLFPIAYRTLTSKQNME